MVNILLSNGIIDDPYIYVYLKEYIKKDMNVLIIPWAFDGRYPYSDYRENGAYYIKMQKYFIPYSIPSKNIVWLDYYNDSKDICLSKINNADIIYFTGGLPDKLYERLEEFELVQTLENFKKIMIGSSAGAVIQFSKYHLTPDIDYKKFALYKGLNILDDFGVEVHYTKSFRQKRCLKKVKKLIDRDYYTIPNDSAIIVDNGTVYTIKRAKKHYFK